MTKENNNLNATGPEQNRDRIGAMFNRIASRYDLLNTLLSFGIDQRWRRTMLARMKKQIGDNGGRMLEILDLATGTGDVAIGIKKRFPDARITGGDLAEEMMRFGREKVDRKGLKDIEFCRADAAALPFEDQRFQAVTIAFGIRNFTELDRSFREILRVLKPGGTLWVLEFAWPEKKLVSFLYRVYSNVYIPVAGQVLAGDREAYTYLTTTIRNFPNGSAITGRMKDAGFASATYRPLGAGLVHMYEAHKKEEE